jgi:hemoglobin
MSMRRRIPVLFLLLAISAMQALAAPPQAAGAQQKSLYQRLGGYDAIAAVTDDLMARLIGDPQLAGFFKGLNADSQKRLRGHFVDFLCEKTGGPCAYHGRDMKTAHTGLKISEADWQAAVKDLTATLDKFKVPEQEKSEVLGAVSQLKPDIVGL